MLLLKFLVVFLQEIDNLKPHPEPQFEHQEDTGWVLTDGRNLAPSINRMSGARSWTLPAL